MENDERRLAIWYLPERRVYEVFARRDMPMACYALDGDSIPPPGAELVGVSYDFSRRAFALMLEHPCFTPVPCGAAVPVLDSGSWDVLACDVLERVDDETYRVTTKVL